MRQVRTLLLAVALSASTGVARADEALDRFFGGFLEGCRMGKDFEAFRGSVMDSTNPEMDDPVEQIALPPAVDAAIGELSVETKGDYREVSAPIRGTFRGVPLSRLVFDFGNGNGVHVWSLEFAAEAATVRKVFEAAVTASQTLLKQRDEDGLGYATGLDFSKKRPALWCDMST